MRGKARPYKIDYKMEKCTESDEVEHPLQDGACNCPVGNYVGG